ncbi:MAG: hypothetical protein ACW98I_13895 [Candidatus Hodarchaeales archaeon]|jgi:phage FluMu protein Com
MRNDPRYCLVCNKLLLRQDLFGYVLLTSCDSCTAIVHEICYLEHHQIAHNLIALLIEEEEIEAEYRFQH